jgi:hypothetical protein
MSENFWLYDWIDTLEIKKAEEAESLLKNSGLRKELRKRASEVEFTTEPIPKSDAPTIVAGRAIDLSGDLDCYGWECMKQQIDKLFSNVWHYFDRIVIVGPSAYDFSNLWGFDEKEDVDDILYRQLNYIRLLLYIREIGAEDLVVFRQKRPACAVHLEQHLKDVGLDETLVHSEKLISDLATNAKVIVEEEHDEYINYAFIHPEVEHTHWGAIEKSEARSESALRYAVSAQILKVFLAHLASDIYTARVLKSPLGSTVNLHGQILNSFNGGIQEADVAFKLDLPVLKDVSPKTLLDIRNNEQSYFEKFRQSLRLAIKERIENVSDKRADKIAEEIRMDIINPALSDIELRLNAARKTMERKVGLSAVLGSLVTTCGILTLNPVIAGIGVTAATGGSLTASQKFIEEKRDVSLSDMYFLWKAQEHLAHN